MIKKLLFPLVGVLLYTTAHAQGVDWENYQPLKAKGEVPPIFTEAFTDKFHSQRDDIDAKKRRDRKLEEHFHKRSEYYIDQFLESGKIIFGDTITQYCRAVLDKVIGDNDELKGKIQLFTVKSPIVNAAATANGLIFVNVGLIAQLETEAQLAYILSHELTHYTKNHVLDQYIEQERINRGESIFRTTTEGEKLLALSTHSKAHELEADLEGYEKLYKKSGYAFNAPFEVLDILQYAYLPFDEIPFDTNFFNTQNLHFSKDFFLEETQAIVGSDDYDDATSTHPNILTRRKALEKTTLKDNFDGKNFIHPKSAFTHCQKVARFELSRLYLQERKYASAIYSSYLLLREYPNNKYLQFNVAKALHAISVYLNDGNIYEVIPSPKKIEGSSQQVYHFLRSLTKDEMVTLSLAYSYELHKSYPNDTYIEKLYKRNMYELTHKNKLSPEDFSAISRDSLLANIQRKKEGLKSDNNSPKANSKIDRIKKLKQEKILDIDENFMHYAFVNYFKDTAFVNLFENMRAHYADNHTQSDTWAYQEKHNRYSKNLALGISSAVCIAPEYLKLDQRNKDGIKYITSDDRLIRFKEQLQHVASFAKLDLKVLDYKDIPDFDVDHFNDLALLNGWLQERMSHENHKVMVSDFNYMQSVKDRYNTPYLINTGNVSLRIKENVAGNVAAMVLFPYYIPFGIAKLATPNFESFSYFFLFNIDNSSALMAEYNYYETSDKPDYIKSILYNYFLQVTDVPKKKD